MNTQFPYVAGGCFWGVEHHLQGLPRVVSAVSGFMGGSVENPSYEDVIHTNTGHAETVRVEYDADQIVYESIIKRFFEIHDPTQLNRQGPDVENQYRSAIFCSNDDEKMIVERLIRELTENGYDVVMQIESAGTFYEAEAYHQDYYQKNGQQPYCHTPLDRFSTHNPLAG